MQASGAPKIKEAKMPAITISDATFAKLKSIAEPFVDTPESLVERLIDTEIDKRSSTTDGRGKVQASAPDALLIDPDSHESLSFTRVLSARVDGREMHRPKWNRIFDDLHVLGLKRLGSVEKLKNFTGAGLRRGRYEEEGYRYLSEADISIQGVDANNAWNHALRVARALRVPIKVAFEWRNREGAVHPGQRAVLEWTPPTP
jgi:hypothetical protein